MNILNFSLMRSAKVESKPYQFAKITNLFNLELRDQMLAEYPKNGFEYCEELKQTKTYSMYRCLLYDSRKQDKLNSQYLSSSWQMFLYEILSDEYCHILSKQMNQDLSKCDVEINCWRYHQDCWLSPHTDKVEKVVSQLFYFNDCWNQDWGGGFRILNSMDNDDVYEEIFPTIDTSIILVRSDNSWHSVAPLTCPATINRKLLQIIFWKQ